MLLLIHKIQETKLARSLNKNNFVRSLILVMRRSKTIVIRKPVLFLFKKIFNFSIITRNELISQPEKYRLIEFESEELLPFMKACDFNLNFDKLESIAGFVDDLPEKRGKEKFFIYEVDDAELVGFTALGIDKEGNVLLETALPVSALFGKLQSKVIAPNQRIPLEECLPSRTLVSRLFSTSNNSPELDIACSLVMTWSRNYYHWLVDCLARLESVELYREKTGIKPTLIVRSNPTVWQKESLQLLGYEPQDYICWNTSRMKVKKLLVPSFRRSPELHVSPIACRWLRQRMLSNLSQVKSENSYSPYVYISRDRAVGRRVINEKEVIEALKPFGVVSYTLEDFSFSEEVRLFSQAKIVIGSQGAGLANMIFSENLTVIELFSSRLRDDTFFNLAKELGFRYGFLKCKSPRTDFRPRAADIIVNVDRLQALVASCLTDNS